ncbi:MAG: acyl-CoA dehydrogenase family protein [Deltaproteobacteria bacterium]|nr:acyl-CoA dehydrogenase family protein [Deltaproteobacteria bacterium]
MNFELTEEQVMLRSMARKFAEQEMLPTLRDYERQRKINYDVIKKMGSLGLIGAHIAQEYGGAGLDYTSAAIVWEQLSWASWTQTLISLGAGVLPGTILMNAATEEQKQKYLPPLCRGEIIMATAAVEPDAGSDATAVETTAVLDGDEWVINGTKNFISAGGIADVTLVLVQTDKSKGTRGLALIAVDKDTPGFSSAAVEMVGDRAGDLASLGFSDCRVPGENLVGQVGRGIQNSLTGIDTARLFIAAGAIGMAQSCLDACIKYAKERCQFGKPIASFQLVQEVIARMQAETEAIRWQVYYAAELKSKGLPHAKELSSAKWLATELAVRASAEAIRLHGAYGCTDDFPVEHHYRDAILSTILGGTTEMHKLTIGRELLGINAIV